MSAWKVLASTSPVRKSSNLFQTKLAHGRHGHVPVRCYSESMTTRLYWHPIYLEHLTPPGHPERPDRIRALMSELEGPDFYRLDRVEAPRGDEASVLLAHPEKHLEAIRAGIPEPASDEEVPAPVVKLDGDTYVSPKSLDAALTAIGAATAAVDDVFSGAANNVFVAARPPGHHAERSTAMGFCDCGPSCATTSRRGTCRYRRLGCPSRQRNAGYFQGRSKRPVLFDASVSLVSRNGVEGRNRRRQHLQCTTFPRYGKPRIPRGI